MQVNTLADGIFASKIFLNEKLINNSNERRPFVIVHCEKAPAKQRNSHDLEIVRLHDVVQRPLHVVFIRRLRLTIDPEKLFVVTDHRKRSPRLRSSFNARSGCELGIEFAHVGPNRGWRRAHHRWGQRQSKSEYIVGLKSRVRAPEHREASDHQPRTNQQHQRHGHLRDDEDSLSAMTRATTSKATLLQRFMQPWL